MLELNSFQRKCKKKLIDKLESCGIKINDIRVQEADEKWFAPKEAFIEANINNLKIWIYPDGTHIQGENIDFPMELLDYKSDDKLIQTFIDRIINLLDVQ